MPRFAVSRSSKVSLVQLSQRAANRLKLPPVNVCAPGMQHLVQGSRGDAKSPCDISVAALGGADLRVVLELSRRPCVLDLRERVADRIQQQLLDGRVGQGKSISARRPFV